MTAAHLLQWIAHPEMLDKDTLYELRTLVARYPYFQSARLLYLKNLYLLHDATFGAELRKSVLYVSDRRMLFYLIEGDRYLLQPRQGGAHAAAAQGEEQPGIDRTLFLIDSFLATVPDEQVQAAGLDYSVDYTSYLLQMDGKEEPEAAGRPQADTPRLRGQELIDGFLEQGAQAEKCRTDVAEEEQAPPPSAEIQEAADDTAESVWNEAESLDEGCFTETLAKIYIKQHRYEKALEIIKKLNLNYPKKNAYFADQIRFLEKLIINAKSK